MSDLLVTLGKSYDKIRTKTVELLSFLGYVTTTLLSLFIMPQRLRLVSLFYYMEHVGLRAIPIVSLLTFLVGVVLAYQGSDQLAKFGAEILTVNLVGIATLREVGILLAAIIVAGRSGSAFTAQIGTMHINEEIDAMRTMGLDPACILVLPRLIALVICLPVLTIVADISGVAGGALACEILLDISYDRFYDQFAAAVGMQHLWVGLIKAPVFGFIIAVIGCFEGLKVTGSAESVGQQTTKSVVESIFIVIVVDAVFSIFFSRINM